MSTAISPSALSAIRSQLSKLKVPSSHDKVFNDECMFSFDTPYSPEGLFINLINWQGYGKDYYLIDSSRSGCKLYLHSKWDEIVRTPTIDEKVPTKLAIGVDGGFSAQSPYETIKSFALVVLTDSGEERIPLPNADLPEFLTVVIDAVKANEGSRAKMDVSTWDASNEIVESKYARSLEQLSNGKKVSNDPSTWRCEVSGESNNLWLNLSTGFIGGGRKNWDGSGGSGAALQHYIDTGRKYPLCVKLGTITPQGGGDVWSYSEDEDCLVSDPLLAQHLAHWGVNTQSLEKTERSMGEIEAALNMTYDWSKMMQGGEEQGREVRGPGRHGLVNIGSSCYMNSVLQPLLAMPEIRSRYQPSLPSLLLSSPSDPSQDLLLQIAKLAQALYSDRYVDPTPPSSSHPSSSSSSPLPPLSRYLIAPRTLKAVVSRGHLEFSSNRQQDASEYLMVLLDRLGRAERGQGLARMGGGGVEGLGEGELTSSLFEFHLQTEYRCQETGRVRFSPIGRDSLRSVLELPIPLPPSPPSPPTTTTTSPSNSESKNEEKGEEKGEGKGEEKEEREAKMAKTEESDPSPLPLPSVPFQACLDSYFSPSFAHITNPSLSPPCPTHTSFQPLFYSFPRYLVIKLARYYVDREWKERKVVHPVPMPLHLDLQDLRARGLQPGDEEMTATSTSSPSPSSPPSLSPDVLASVLSMGFSEQAALRAVRALGEGGEGGEGVGEERVIGWILEHIDDSDLNEPLPSSPPPSTSQPSPAPSPAPPSESIESLVSFGFSPSQASRALTLTDNDIERAAEWLFSHSEELEEEAAMGEGGDGGMGGGEGTTTTPTTSTSPSSSSSSRYSLFSVISHLGRNACHGHYVCHIREREGGEGGEGEGGWLFFNDEKVMSVPSPPLDQGFIYIYKKEEQ